MLSQHKLYHLQIKDKNSYYGSITALFELNSAETLGVTRYQIDKFDWKANKNVFQNDKVRIQRDVLVTAKAARLKKHKNRKLSSLKK